MLIELLEVSQGLLRVNLIAPIQTENAAEKPKKIHLSSEKRQETIDKLRFDLIYNGISKNNKFVRQWN